MVEKRACYVCGTEIGENENFCPACGADAPPIKVNFDEFVDEEFNANVGANAVRPTRRADSVQKSAQTSADSFDDFFSDLTADTPAQEPQDASRAPSSNESGQDDFLFFDDAYNAPSQADRSPSDAYAESDRSDADGFLFDLTQDEEENTKPEPYAAPQNNPYADVEELFSDSQRPAPAPEKRPAPQARTNDADLFDDFFSGKPEPAPAPEPQNNFENPPAGRRDQANMRGSFDEADVYGFDLDSDEPVQTPSPARHIPEPEYDPLDELIRGTPADTERRSKPKAKKTNTPKEKSGTSSNLIVPIVVVSVLVVAALITIIAIVVTKKDDVDVIVDSDSYIQDEPAIQTDSIPSDSSREITGSFSSQQINWLNLFISNFTEACITSISPDSPKEDLIDYAVNHAVLNNNSNIVDLGSNRMRVDSVIYDKSVSASYISQRIERYFDVTVSPSSTRRFLYYDGQYYIPETTPLNSLYYSKVDRILQNDDNTITVDYVSFVYGGGSTIPSSVYYGTAVSASDTRIGTGCAVLKYKYVGENAANYALVRLYSTGGQTTLRNEEQTTSAIRSSSVPDYWAQYEDGLVPENRNYRIELDEDDWNILFRSTPEKIDQGQPGYNVIDKISSGTVVYVDYIYNGKWAAFTYNGKHGFASIYAFNDPSASRIMNPYG